MIVMGGDVTGKVVIPLVEAGDGAVTAELFGQPERARRRGAGRARAPDPLQRHVPARDDARGGAARRRADRGGEREAWFAEVMLDTFARWMALADERLEDERSLLRDARQRRPARRRRGDRAGGRGRGVRRADRRVRGPQHGLARLLQPHAVRLAARARRGRALRRVEASPTRSTTGSLHLQPARPAV